MLGDFESRVACVYGGVYGSGYLIAPALVLTAGHAAREPTGRVQFLHEDRWWDCERIWLGDDDADAALLEITDPDWRPRVLEPIRWGRLTGTHPCPWEAVGFPDVELPAAGLRQTSHLSGMVNPGTLLRGCRYAGLITGVPSSIGTGSPWAGLSGAPFVCGELLTGVIIEDSADWASGRIEAVAVPELAKLPAFRRIVEMHTARRMIVESVELSGLLGQPRMAGNARSPASLLRADAATVRFRGRKDLLNKLTRWCRGDDVSVRLITGPGGQGKTRFAREFAAHLQSLNWVAGWLTASPGAEADYGPFRQTREPLLIVIDYAETRVDEVARLLSRLVHRPTAAAVRVLLLARSSGDWWERVKTSAPGIREFVSDAVIELPALELNVNGRRKAFTEAVNDLGSGLAGIPMYKKTDWRSITGAIKPPEDLQHPRYEKVLAIHMAALASLLQAATPTATQAGGLLEDVLLDHEQRYWEQTAEAYRIELHRLSMPGTVATAALTQAPTKADALAICGSVPGLHDLRENEQLAITLWLHDLYPGAGGEYWAALQPDRLAEHLIGRVATDTPDFLERLLPGLPVNCLDHAFIVLGRAWINQPELGSQVREVIVRHPDETAVPAARAASKVQNPEPISSALNSFLDQGKLPFKLVSDLFLAISPQVHAMAPIALRVAVPIAQELKELSEKEPDKFLSQYGWILNQICARMWQARMHDQAALSIGERAVTILRRLAALDEDRHSLSLGEALNTLAVQLSEGERHEESLPAGQEAVSIYRQAASASPHARFGLAAALNTVATQLSRLGRNDEALVAVDEAVQLAREISAGDADSDFPLLPGCLSNRASVLGALHRYRDALKAVDEAIRGQVPLAQMRPDPHTSDLAAMVHMRAGWLVMTDRPRESLTACREFVTMVRSLAAAHPGAMQPKLARFLQYTAVISNQLGDRHLAVDAAADAVAFSRRLAAAQPEKYRRELADSLRAQANYLRLTGGLIAARQAAMEAVETARNLADDDQEARLSCLADALIEAGTCYRDLEQPQRALPLVAEAVTCCRALAADGSPPSRDALAAALNQCSNRLSETGCLPEAGPLIEEAVSIRRELAEQEPGTYRSSLAASLHDLAVHLLRTGDTTSALAVSDEAIVARRETLDERGSLQDNDVDLASFIGTRGGVLAEMGRKGEALEAINEALRIHGQPTDGRSELAFIVTLLNKANLLETSGAAQEALAALDQAIKQQRKQAIGSTDRNRSQAVQVWIRRGKILLALGRAAEALSALHEARALSKRLGQSTGEIDVYIARAKMAAPGQSAGPERAARSSQRHEPRETLPGQKGTRGKPQKASKKKHR